ncbi:MAG: hypothetical protein FJ403_11945 [Verrucomicrobia bacterium]|nr:hypothetical protein [Verrucomicrobiota bacterium]
MSGDSDRTINTRMKPGDLPVSWFDFVVLVVLVVGCVVGRKRGMSEELLDVFQWLLIVVVSALYYEPIGRFVAGYTAPSLMLSYIVTYLCLVLSIRLFFGWIKRMIGEKLVASDLFGRMEYYLGMVAGGLRFSCILLLLLAVLNARLISADQLAGEAKMQQENFGTITFPTLGSLQQTVFNQSASGRFVKKYMNDQLIVHTPAEAKLVQREGVAQRREKVVNEVLIDKK